MGYDLKMFDGEIKEASVIRMNAAQRKKFDDYYGAVKEDLAHHNLSGNALTEWKFQRYMKDYFSTAASLDRNIGRTLDYLDKNDLAKIRLLYIFQTRDFILENMAGLTKDLCMKNPFALPW